jgi:hypothetical protein
MSPRPIPKAVHDKLARIMPRLGSDSEPERIATVAAIDRVLKGAGLDWHDFTAAFGLQPTPPQHPPWEEPAGYPRQPPPRQPPPPADAADEFQPTQMDADKLLAVIDDIFASGSYLSAKSRDFLDGMHERAEVYSTVYISAKQHKWLADLAVQSGVAI